MDAYTQARQQRIVEDVTSVIDYTSRILGGVEGGNWYYARDKIRSLRNVLTELERHLDRDDPKQPGKLDQIRGETVWAKVRQATRGYRLGRVIFPSNAPKAQP